jgi:HupE / UreJ protein
VSGATLRRIARALAAAAALLSTALAWAHKPSDSYLSIQVGSAAGPTAITGQWDIALRDLDFAIGLDANADGEITWGELRAKHAEIAAYALARLAVDADGQPCALRAGDQLVDQHSDGAYTVLRFSANCPRLPAKLGIGYRLFADIDPQHRGLLRLQALGSTRSAIFSPQAAMQSFELQAVSRWQQFIDFGGEGVWHIWIGFDHILFLLSLLLPAVLVWQAPAWVAAQSFRAAFWEVAKIVTAFTLAHSITLSLATLGLVSLPSRLVESAIALSVLLAALNNVRALFHGKRWMVAFFFGLIHGFGFASVLGDLGLTQGTLLLALVGFNLGVECGQLAIVSAFLPIAYALRRGWFYQRLVFAGGSLLIAVIAGIWFAERAFDFKLLPF